MTNYSTSTAMAEILATKDKYDVLQFPTNQFFIDGKGWLKLKYFKAVQRLAKNNIIKLKATFNESKGAWDWNWIINK